MRRARVGYGEVVKVETAVRSWRCVTNRRSADPRRLIAVMVCFGLGACGSSASSNANANGGHGSAQGGQAGASPSNAGGTSGGAGAGAAAGNASAGAGGTVSSGSGGAVGTGGVPDDPPPTGPFVFAAVGYGGHRTRSLDGSHWQDHIIVDPKGGDDNNLLRGVNWAHGRFIAVGNQILVSPDGAQWTKVSFMPNSFLNQSAYGNGVWVSAGGNGLRIRSTDNGNTWGSMTDYYAGHYRGLAFGNGRFVAVGHTYGASMNGMWSTSTDGVTWTAPQVGGDVFGRVAFGKGVFVAVGDNGRVSVSTDGQTWQTSTLGTRSRSSVIFANDEFITEEDAGLEVSPDGKAWTAVKTVDKTQVALFQFAAGHWVGSNPGGVMLAAEDPTRFRITETMPPDLVDIAVGYLP